VLEKGAAGLELFFDGHRVWIVRVTRKPGLAALPGCLTRGGVSDESFLDIKNLYIEIHDKSWKIRGDGRPEWNPPMAGALEGWPGGGD
jgi:hypothetical protein